jgi:hypothetical protein
MKNRKHSPSISLKALVLSALGIITQVHAAAPFTPNDQPPGYAAPIALSTDCLQIGCTLSVPTNTLGGGKAYRPWFENGAWQGDLVEYSVTALGKLSTTIDLTVNPPINTLTKANWSARLKFDGAATALTTWWNTARKVITMNGSSQVAFRWETLGAAQKTALDSVTALAAPASPPPSPVLNFVRGDRSGEATNGGTYRNRYNVLGDIMHSNPVYVGAPKANYSFDEYPLFKAGAAASRSARIYVGANDGMVHAFDATGAEVYAYIPSMLIGNLSKLKANPYAHTYFVDGPLSAGDAYFGGSWKTVLVGGLGAGGKGVFALDVTNPDLTLETANTGDNKKVLWELNATSDNDLGYTYSKSVIARLNDGKWYAVMGNGYNSVNGKAILYLIDVVTGTVKKIATDDSGSGAAPNGLSSPVLLDVESATNGDNKADYAYAGDIDGNMWKFDLTDTDPANWAVSYGKKPLHSGSSTQAITTAPDLVAFNTGYLVYFGTGQAFTVASLVDTDTQSIYAIYDTGSTPGTASLVSQTMTEVIYTNAAPLTDQTVRWITNNSIDWSTNTGWKIDLPDGERLLTNPVVRAERLQFVSTNPTIGHDAADWLIEPDYKTGGPPSKTIFDLNENSVLNSADDYSGKKVVGWKKLKGLASQPTFAIVKVLANNAGTIDTLFINNLILPYVETCSGQCAGGFVGGHVDVQTDSPKGPDYDWSVVSFAPDGLGNNEDGHEHEYDKIHGMTDVDLFSLEPRRGKVPLSPQLYGSSTKAVQRLNRVTEVKNADGTAAPFSSTKKFIVVLANADLSPGGTLTIGDKSWNVVDYQKMVTNKLVALGATQANSGNFKDDADGVSLVYTLNDILAKGTLRVSFDNMAIIAGGLHPTIPQCVWSQRNPYDDVSVSSHVDYNKHITIVPNGASKDPSATTGYRWRNGALTVQLLDVDTGYALQDSSFMPKDKDGFIVGGIHAKKYSAMGLDKNVKDATKNAITVSEGANESGLLYEVTMFWHFGDLYKYRNNHDAACYGSSNWQAAVNIERGGLTWGEYQALLGGLTDTSPEIVRYAAALKALEDYFNSGGTDEVVMKALVDEHNAAVAAIAEYVKLRGYVLDLGAHHPVLAIDETTGTTPPVPGAALPGQPAAVTGDPDTPGDTVGPNYTPGRRSWTEITPKN